MWKSRGAFYEVNSGVGLDHFSDEGSPVITTNHHFEVLIIQRQNSQERTVINKDLLTFG
jgi:hypothetical protein